MATFNLKPTHKAVKDYYKALRELDQLGIFHETAVRVPFRELLDKCARRFRLTVVNEYSLPNGRRIDGAVVDKFRLTHGYWEAKDTEDDLAEEVKKKFAVGYPKDNILFQAPNRAILWQAGEQVLDLDLGKPENLVETLRRFFTYRKPEIVDWEDAIGEFKGRVRELADGLAVLIEEQRKTNRRFVEAFDRFMALCKASINPNLAVEAVEEMLIQHLLTERIFRKVFDNPEFVRRNVIAAEIERVIEALTSRSFSRRDFLKNLDVLYFAIERTAATIHDFTQKQHFLNTIYEQFFQGFSVKVADTHGIVYTPQPIVNFMVKSVEDILEREFGKSLSDKNVHILDPFVGTGNFIVRIMREIKKAALPYKYENELHCNEVMLLPYYIASLNIEHEYFAAANEYKPFEGICLVDTFGLDNNVGQKMIFTPENTRRVKRQRESSIYVVIGNPPYNAGQVNENDANKNRKYKIIDNRVAETYAAHSSATNKNALSDPYVKAIRWASDLIGKEGIVAFVSNNSFIDAIAFDGMRKHLADDFSTIYHVNLRGNARTSGERRRKEAGNIFDDMIRVSVGITFFIKKTPPRLSDTEIFIYSVNDYLKSAEKQEFLFESGCLAEVPVRKFSVDKDFFWLSGGIRPEFETFISIGNRETKRAKDAKVSAVFRNYGRGVATCRDAWAYNFQRSELQDNISRTIDVYNRHVILWPHRKDKDINVDDFVDYNDREISWGRDLKLDLMRDKQAEYSTDKVRKSLYRPFTKSFLFFDRIMNEEVYQIPHVFPTQSEEKENRVISLNGLGSKKPFYCMMVSVIPDVQLTMNGQCFPFYTYDEDGSNRRENITDWALDKFRVHYRDAGIVKWDIFHYIYALLHHPDYRERYEANLRRELPRIPFAPDFRAFVRAGERLAELHVFYEKQPEYNLEMIETPGAALDWRIEKMRLSKDKKSVKYNDFLTLAGIPAEAFDYRLGNRSALDWVIDQYRIRTDKRSGIVNDPNRPDDPQYIKRLIGQAIAVSLETVKIVASLPEIK